MSKQLSMSFLHDELKEVKTHKREFLEKMDSAFLRFHSVVAFYLLIYAVLP